MIVRRTKAKEAAVINVVEDSERVNMSDPSSHKRRQARLGKSKSAGGGFLVRSPSDRTAPPPPAPPLDPMIPPPSPGKSATPPKKSWERHYRSFLTRKLVGGGGNQHHNNSNHSPPGLASASSPASPHKKGLIAGPRRLLRNLSRGSHSSKDALDSSPKDYPSMPQMPVLSKGSSDGASEEDVAVRGGNFFQNVFHHNNNNHQGKSVSSDAISKSGRLHRRIKSNDTLDTTMKRGQDKSYSPVIQTSVKSFEDAERPVHGGVLKSRHSHSTAASSGMSNLPRALASSTSSSHRHSKEMKKAFTEFHNSSQFAQDSTSAYLGDDPSVRRNNYFAQVNQQVAARATSGSDAYSSQSERHHRAKTGSFSAGSLTSMLDTVDEHIQAVRSTRMLRKVEGPEQWENGRRYLVAPAAMSVCPLNVFSNLSSANTVPDYTDTAFGMVKLGRATVKYEGISAMAWSTCDFVLRQNYLLEYDVDANMLGKPRAFGHLQHAKCYKHGDFPDVLELEFYLSPCAKSEKRIMFIRVQSREERDRWVMCLNDAAQLTVRDFYDFNEATEFGRGRFAAVYPATRISTAEPNNGTTEPYDCALKIIKKNEFWKRVAKGMERADSVVREVSVQATLTARCNGIPTFLQIQSFFETSDDIVLELELLEGTDLFQYIASKGHLEEREAAEIMRDLLTSLDAMCRVGVAHRDVKPANILMCTKDKHTSCVKLGDFGMSTFVGVDGLVRGRCGTPGYVAPEIFSAGVNAGYGNKVDVFSAGVTLYVMLCGYEPFYGESDAELIAANKAAEVDFPDDWDNVSDEARDLLTKMTEKDPQKRVTASEALNHSWITRQVPKASWSTESAALNRMTLSSSVDHAACTIS